MIDLETRVRIKMWFLTNWAGWPFTLVAWLRSWALPHRNGFGRFDANETHRVLSQAAEQLSRARRRQAGVFLRDAQRVENAIRTRADLAFDAIYLCALAALGLAAEEYQHPSPAALEAAAVFLGLTAEQIKPAMAYAEHRYAPPETDAQSQAAFEWLVTLAKKILKPK